MESDDDISRWNYSRSSWAIFGAHEAMQTSKLGLLSIDLNKGNVWLTEKDGVKIIEYGGLKIIKYPKEWEIIPKGLMSLLRWLDDPYIAAFRFGYLQYGGPIAALVFDSLRERYGLNSFRNIEDLNYEPIELLTKTLPDEEELIELENDWKMLRHRLVYGNLTKASLDLHHLYQWRSERKKMGLEKNIIANEYHYNKHLVAAVAHGSLKGFLEALMNIQGVCQERFEITKALGILRFCRRLCLEFPERISEEFKSQIFSIEKAMSECAPDQGQKDLDRISCVNDIFKYLWYLDDIEVGNISLVDSLVDA